MSWLRIDDGFIEHTKVMELSDRALRLHMAGLCFCARNLTDGLLTVRASKTVCALVDAHRRHLVELRDADLWVPLDDGWQIKNYLDYNPDRETAKTLREKRSEAGRAGGIRSGEVRRASGTLTPAERAKRAAAASRANTAQKAGRLSPLPCENCSSDGAIEKHHEDYDKPEEVIWLCRGCHVELHKRRKANKALASLPAKQVLRTICSSPRVEPRPVPSRIEPSAVRAVPPLEAAQGAGGQHREVSEAIASSLRSAA